MDLATQIDEYQPTPETMELVRSTKIALLAGISGAGKDTIKRHILQDVAYQDIVSHTTRAPRHNNGVHEIDGEDYHFISLETAQKMLAQQAFVEAKFVHGTVYGTSVAELQRAKMAHRVAITDIDIQGVMEYKNIAPESVAIFIVPPDCDTWLDRLKRRYQTEVDFLAEWDKRRASAIRELESVLEQPYFHVIINDDLARAVRVVKEIIERGDTFNQHDRDARTVARALLETIKKPAV